MALDLKTFSARVRVTDGAVGTALQGRGLLQGKCPEQVNLEAPEVMEEIARSYVQAGSEVLLTNSLNAHRPGLASYGLARRAAEIARRAVEIARRAAEGTAARVFGSFGPSGSLLLMEQTTEAELAAAFAETASGLAAGGAEAIVLETFNDLDEARIAVTAVQSVCELPIVLSMAFAFGPQRMATMMGQTPEDLAVLAASCGIAAIGANCGVGPDLAVGLARRLRLASPLPVWIKPNAGLPVLREGRTVFPVGPQEFAGYAPAIRDAGGNFIGGCCGTGPDHIRAIRRALGL